jgi:L-asparaginase/Glu-tRNA(Gln) amidotransferase subunit D
LILPEVSVLSLNGTIASRSADESEVASILARDSQIWTVPKPPEEESNRRLLRMIVGDPVCERL